MKNEKNMNIEKRRKQVREAQARFKAKQREEKKTRLGIYVTRKEKKAIDKLLAEMRSN